VFSVCPFDPLGNSDGLHTDPFVKLEKPDSLDSSLTLAILQAAVVAHRAEEFKNEDSYSYNSQAHDEHHHPHRWTVGFCEGKQKINKKEQIHEKVCDCVI